MPHAANRTILSGALMLVVALPDGTTYQAATTLDAPAKKVSVRIENSGHRPVSQ